MTDTTNRVGDPGNGETEPGDGSIPSGPTGVGVGAGEPSTFEPEEDPEAAAQRDGSGREGE